MRKTTVELQYIVWASREINDILKAVALMNGNPRQASAISLLKYLRASQAVDDFTIPLESTPLVDVPNAGSIISIAAIPGLPIGTTFVRDGDVFRAASPVHSASRGYVLAHPEMFEAV